MSAEPDSAPEPGAGWSGFVRAGWDEVPLHVRVEGRGPVCVLSAGLGLSWFDWDAVAELLAPYRTVVRFDRPGHGLSAPAAVPPTAVGEAHRIAALLDALAPRLPAGPVTVVGHSVAGFHAEVFARLYPDRTTALVLADGSVEEDVRTTAAGTALRTASARALGAAVTAVGLLAALGPLVRRAAVWLSRPDGVDRPAPPARALVRRCYRTGRVWRGALLENARYPDAAAEVLALRTTRPLTAPVVVLAAHDGSASRSALHWLARQAALADALGARFEVAEPAGHLVMQDRPHEVVRAVLGAIA
ncbi:alpha/beta fold hydrolase [Streptomyces sp. bgisy060]|uniref:alpha/beta fold hydrolase n=1 Tax=Streptomyces sp. bgisy060 TaxID=3413775 RepID=UPI003EC11DE9